jgi:UDP-N-acetylmuramate--alanine ligase
MTKQAYFIGIKGVGMTALALAMQDAGWTIQGSDTTESFITDDVLQQREIIVNLLDAPLPTELDLVVYSAAYVPPTTGVKTLSLAEAVAEFVKDRQVLAVAGVGGKTTTSAMLAALFHAASRNVGYYVGTSTIAGLDAPGKSGTDPWYVIEADEYAISKTDTRPKFSLLNPQILVTTNIIHDHPDIYSSEEETLKVFTDLIKRIPTSGTWIACETDPLTQKILATEKLNCTVITYSHNHPLFTELKLSVFGDQNRLDAIAAVLASVAAGVSQTEALQGIKSYRGAGRRQESHGEVMGRLLYDDYGHHPEEISVTVKSFKEHFPGKKVILVFESHTYTRTESLLDQFAQAIALADLPVIMPIFESAREKGQPHQITPESFAQEVKKYNAQAIAVTWENAAKKIWELSQNGDIILTMGAGFVYKLHEQFKLQSTV